MGKEHERAGIPLRGISEQGNQIHKPSGKHDVDLNIKPRTVSNRMDNLGFKELRHKDRSGSYFEIPPGVFETIVAPLCPEIVKKSSQSSQSSQLGINKINKRDESVKKRDERDESGVTSVI